MSIDLKKNEQELADSIMSRVNLSKDKVNLEKKVVNLSKCIVNLSKKNSVDIGSTEAQVVFVIDASGSMDEVFDDGTLQSVITTLVPVVLTFDDNGKAEVYRFNDSCKKLEDLSLANYETYVKDCMGYPSSTTKYSGPLKAILEDYFGIVADGHSVKHSKPKKKGLFGRLFGKKDEDKAEVTQSSGSMADTNEYPVFVLYITDGDIDFDDKDRMNQLVVESSKENCFIQFIGASKRSSFEYLVKLDDLPGRNVDNTGFVKFDDLKNISDEQLYNAVLAQYAEWLKERGF